MLTALKDHVAKHAVTYLIAVLLGAAASMSAIYDNLWILSAEDGAKLRWWHWIALWSKCIAPFAATVVATLIKSPLSDDKPADPKPNTP